MDNQLVSVIMPSYNTAHLIKESIDSVLNQTYANFELIIIDDCSTDNTDEVVAEYKDERIVYLKNEEHGGAAVSRNHGLREAKGKWVAFLDSDDLWEKDKLSKQVAFMQENGYNFSYTNYEKIDEQGNSLNCVVSGPKKISKRKMRKYCWIGCLTVMYDREHVGLIQIENIQKNNDYAMWLKVCKKADCYLLNETLAKYRKGRTGSIRTIKTSRLITWYYKMYRLCEKKCVIPAWYCTFRNVFFGVLKKIVYEKRK